MRQFARMALALLAAAGILFGGGAVTGSQAAAAPAQGLTAGVAAGPSLVEKTGYHRHRLGRYDCTKIWRRNGSFDLYCHRRERLVKKYLCDKHVDGPDWRMHCKVIWVKPERCCGHGWRHGRR